MKLSQYLSQTGMTDAAFGELVGLSQPQVSRLRRGVSKPSWDSVPIIEKITEGAVTAADFAAEPKQVKAA